MKFKLEIEIDTDKDSPNTIGELIRDKFWPRKAEYDLGCYSNFDYGYDVIEIEPRKDEDGNLWRRARWAMIMCEWYWDGDGTLRFVFHDGKSLINTDCKKDYTWEWEK